MQQFKHSAHILNQNSNLRQFKLVSTGYSRCDCLSSCATLVAVVLLLSQLVINFCAFSFSVFRPFACHRRCRCRRLASAQHQSARARISRSSLRREWEREWKQDADADVDGDADSDSDREGDTVEDGRQGKGGQGQRKGQQTPSQTARRSSSSRRS